MNATVTHPNGTVTEHTKKTKHQFTHVVVREGSPEAREYDRLTKLASDASVKADQILDLISDPEIQITRDHDTVISAASGYIASLVGTSITFLCGSSLQTVVFQPTGEGVFQKMSVTLLEAIAIEVVDRAREAVDLATALTATRDAIDLDRAVSDSWEVVKWAIREDIADTYAADMNGERWTHPLWVRKTSKYTVRAVDAACTTSRRHRPTPAPTTPSRAQEAEGLRGRVLPSSR